MSADLNIESELAICEAAQSGPWKYDPAGMLVFGATDDTLIAEVRGWGLLERLYGTTKAMAMQDATGVFIAQARTGYPLALRRIQELEKQLAAALAERDALAKCSIAYMESLFNEHRAILLSCNVAAAIAERQDAERKLKAAIGPLTPDTEATEQ